MIEEQADKMLELLERIAVALETSAKANLVIANRLERLVQIEEKRWGMTPTTYALDLEKKANG